MKNVMLDLETMGNSSNSAIIAIGAVVFDEENLRLDDKFYVTIDLKSNIDAGLQVDPDTIMWWMKQSDAARSQFEDTTHGLEAALAAFSTWIPGDAIVWGNGAAFDNVILGNAYKALGLNQPWAFWNDRCYRTVKSMYPEVKMKRLGTYHCAVDDAVSQAAHLMEILKIGEHTYTSD
jgi:exodeoxyribonuclease VIII